MHRTATPGSPTQRGAALGLLLVGGLHAGACSDSTASMSTGNATTTGDSTTMEPPGAPSATVGSEPGAPSESTGASAPGALPSSTPTGEPSTSVPANGTEPGGVNSTAPGAPSTSQQSDPSTSSPPSAPSAACELSVDRLRITEVELGSAVDVNEDEATLRPLVLSPLPSGGSRLAWMGADGKLHITTLTDNDQLSGEELTLEANDFSDVLADEKGGVALLTRNAHGDGDQHCGTLTNLCGNAATLPAQYACWDMYLVRFDETSETWATQLTESAADKPPYLSSPTDESSLIYIWEAYAHHGRIATDGARYASYYGAAISIAQDCVQSDSSESTGVNIHQGDRLDVISASGERLADDGAFPWGCSHSGYERVLWDPRAERWVPVCKTDNNNRLALAPNYATIAPVDLGANNISDAVLHPSDGYWLAASDAQSAGDGLADVHLLHFTIIGNQASVVDKVAVAAATDLNERAPYLAPYGTDGLLIGWESSTTGGDLRSNDSERTLRVQVRDAASGQALGEALEVDVLGNRYQAFRAFPDGSVGFPTKGNTPTSVRILRVLPCEK